MLENPSSSDSSATANIATSKRYAPPNQRNRSLGRRKSGADRLERASSYPNEGERNQVAASKNVPNLDHRDAGSSILVNEKAYARLISLHGCCSSEAFHLLNDRWAAAMDAYNNLSIDSAERPILYSGSGASAWGNFRLTQQSMPQSPSVGPSSGSQMNFLSELKRAMQNANAKSNA